MKKSHVYINCIDFIDCVLIDLAVHLFSSIYEVVGLHVQERDSEHIYKV
jgi:hypothetical protein